MPNTKDLVSGSGRSAGFSSTLSVYDSGSRTHATGTYAAPYYTVAWGDMLYSIATRFGVPTQTLKTANGLQSDVIQPGQVLLIPGATASQPPVAAPPSTSIKRIAFPPGAISASRTGVTQGGQPIAYVLAASPGQKMKLSTYSPGEQLIIAAITADGQCVPMMRTNSSISNYVFGTLPV